MATKKKSSKNEQAEKFNEISNNFYERIYRVQDELIEMGRNFISYWLQEADSDGQFNDTIDWMLSSDAEELMKNNEGVFAFQIVCYAWEKFLEGDEDWDEEVDDESDDESGDEEETIYDKARAWFDV